MGDIKDGAGRHYNEFKIIISKSTRWIDRFLFFIVLEEKQVQPEGVIVYP